MLNWHICFLILSSAEALCSPSDWNTVLAPFSLRFPPPKYPVCSDWSAHTGLSHQSQQQNIGAKYILSANLPTRHKLRGDIDKEFNISLLFQSLISPLFPPSSCSHTNRQNVAWHFFNVSISILPLETLKDPQAVERRLLTACDGPFIYLCLLPVYILSCSLAHCILWGLSKRWRSEGAWADIDLHLYGCCTIHPSYPCFSLLTLTLWLLLWSLFLLSLFCNPKEPN